MALIQQSVFTYNTVTPLKGHLKSGTLGNYTNLPKTFILNINSQ